MDDQAETVLLRLLRGAGGAGLSAIRARRGIYVRPLLDCRRDELRADLAGARRDLARGQLERATSRFRATGSGTS